MFRSAGYIVNKTRSPWSP